MSQIHIIVDDGEDQQAVEVSVSLGAEHLHPDANSNSAFVARVMLQSAAYLFAEGQRVSFGVGVPLECLK